MSGNLGERRELSLITTFGDETGSYHYSHSTEAKGLAKANIIIMIELNC